MCEIFLLINVFPKTFSNFTLVIYIVSKLHRECLIQFKILLMREKTENNNDINKVQYSYS